MNGLRFYRTCWSILLLSVTVPSVWGQGFAPAGFITQDCLDCMCEGISKCQMDIGCQNVGYRQYYCGPYQISFSYWQDSGSPGEDPNDPLDFEKCLNDRVCAEAAIRGYMGKWARDCDGNKEVDCYDLARIHMAGPDGCNGTWVQRTDFWTRFKTCYKQKIIDRGF